MGLFDFVKSIISPKAIEAKMRPLAEDYIRLTAQVFLQMQIEMPDLDPHCMLALFWDLHMEKVKKITLHNDYELEKAYLQTWQFSVIPAPGNIRALCLHLLYEDRPDIINACKELGDEYNRLLMPGIAAMKNNQFFSLYEQMNPNMHYETNNGSWFIKCNKI